MIDVVLLGVIISLLLYMAWERYITRREQSKLINALVSKTSQELRDLEFVDKVQLPKVEKPPVDDLIDTNSFTDEKFMEVIRKEEEIRG